MIDKTDLTPAELEVLRQCRMTIWDGYVTSKQARDRLYDLGLIVRWGGWQVITVEGMTVLGGLGEMADNRWPWPKWQPVVMVQATQIVHWPGQDVPACDKHAQQLNHAARALGFNVSCTPVYVDTVCTNCENREKKGTKK